MSQPSSNLLPDNKTQSVSFGDLENQERSRRFTISAQPSSVNLSNQDKSASLPQSRKSSLTNNKSNSEMFQYFSNVTSSTSRHLNHGYFSSGSSSRVTSPTLDEAGHFNKGYSLENLKDGRKIKTRSPSPPPEVVHLTQPIQISKNTNISRKGSQKKSNKTVIASPVGPPVPFQEYLSKEDDGKIHILLACTGSVATIKVPLIIDKLIQIYGKSKISIQLVVTKAAGHFLKGLKIHNDVKIWRDEDEWANYECFKETAAAHLSVNKKPKNPFDKMILHNELRRWADIMLIAPLSANTMAKIVNGISDNLLTSIIRSWGPSTTQGMKKPIIVAPAMNTFMYTHPVTAKQISLLSSPEYGFGIEVLKPVEKVLVCGDIGMGGMREWTELVDILRRRINALTKSTGTGDDIEEEDEDDENNEEKEDDEDEEDEDEDEGDEEDEDEDDEDDEDEDDEDDEDEDDEDDEDEDDEEDDEDNEVHSEKEVSHKKDAEVKMTGDEVSCNQIKARSTKKSKYSQDQSETENNGLIFEITDNEMS